jgi:hypothetical protein
MSSSLGDTTAAVAGRREDWGAWRNKAGANAADTRRDAARKQVQARMTAARAAVAAAKRGRPIGVPTGGVQVHHPHDAAEEEDDDDDDDEDHALLYGYRYSGRRDDAGGDDFDDDDDYDDYDDYDDGYGGTGGFGFRGPGRRHAVVPTISDVAAKVEAFQALAGQPRPAAADEAAVAQESLTCTAIEVAELVTALHDGGVLNQAEVAAAAVAALNTVGTHPAAPHGDPDWAVALLVAASSLWANAGMAGVGRSQAPPPPALVAAVAGLVLPGAALATLALGPATDPQHQEVLVNTLTLVSDAYKCPGAWVNTLWPAGVPALLLRFVQEGHGDTYCTASALEAVNHAAVALSAAVAGMGWGVAGPVRPEVLQAATALVPAAAAVFFGTRTPCAMLPVWGLAGVAHSPLQAALRDAGVFQWCVQALHASPEVVRPDGLEDSGRRDMVRLAAGLLNRALFAGGRDVLDVTLGLGLWTALQVACGTGCFHRAVAKLACAAMMAGAPVYMDPAAVATVTCLVAADAAAAAAGPADPLQPGLLSLDADDVTWDGTLAGSGGGDEDGGAGGLGPARVLQPEFLAAAVMVAHKELQGAHAATVVAALPGTKVLAAAFRSASQRTVMEAVAQLCGLADYCAVGPALLAVINDALGDTAAGRPPATGPGAATMGEE